MGSAARCQFGAVPRLAGPGVAAVVTGEPGDAAGVVEADHGEVLPRDGFDAEHLAEPFDVLRRRLDVTVGGELDRRRCIVGVAVSAAGSQHGTVVADGQERDRPRRAAVRRLSVGRAGGARGGVGRVQGRRCCLGRVATVRGAAGVLEGEAHQEHVECHEQHQPEQQKALSHACFSPPEPPRPARRLPRERTPPARDGRRTRPVIVAAGRGRLKQHLTGQLHSPHVIPGGSTSIPAYSTPGAAVGPLHCGLPRRDGAGCPDVGDGDHALGLSAVGPTLTA